MNSREGITARRALGILELVSIQIRGVDRERSGKSVMLLQGAEPESSTLCQ
jgi:hypothetical protein